MQSVKKFLFDYRLPILTGFLLGTSYIPFYPWALFFCLVPLWYFWFQHQESYKKIFLAGWLAQFIFNMIGFHWITITANEFGGFPKPLSYVILVLFCAIAHVYYPVAGCLWLWVSKKAKLSQTWSLLLLPLVIALLEHLNPTIFFWHLGYPWFWAGWPGAYTAEWVGFYGLQLITLYVNLSLLLFILSKKKAYVIGAITVLIVVNLTGYYLKERFVEGDKELNVLLVQANIGNAIKVQQERGNSFDDFIVNKFLKITQSGLEKASKVDFIVWPETAYPSHININYQRPLQSRLEYFIEINSTPLLSGVYEADSSYQTYNSLALFDSHGKFVDSYKKTYLLAFGEYFPGSSILPQLKIWFPMVSDFGRGKGPKILQLEDLKIGPQICYESLFEDFTAELYRQGAQVIVNVTNDSWYGKHFEPYQHLYMTLARAIEFRIPLVRSTNTGISTAITASGQVLDLSPLHEEWAGTVKLKYKTTPEPTIYSYYAGHWPWILLVFCALVIGGGIFARTRKS